MANLQSPHVKLHRDLRDSLPALYPGTTLGLRLVLSSATVSACEAGGGGMGMAMLG